MILYVALLLLLMALSGWTAREAWSHGRRPEAIITSCIFALCLTMLVLL